MSLSMGIDVGGTFTDFLVVDEDNGDYSAHKSPTTPDDPADGVMNGLTDIADARGAPLGELLADTRLIVHGTTVATNAVLTNRGAKTGLLTTEGFRDVLEMRRGVRSRKHLYDNKYVAPRPLVPRSRRLPVRERIDLSGNVVTEVDEESIRDAIDALARAGVESVAVCFMHSYANPDHEQLTKDLLKQAMPDAFLSISSEVLPQIRLYNRVSTTAMNAYVGPVVQRYTRRLVERLAAAQFGGVLLVMQSNGGVATPDIVGELPASTVLSGPAAGPVAGLAYAASRGSRDCIVIDMGGTSFDASLVKDGEVQVTREGEINRHSLSLPMIDIHAIGAGGGSIAWIDEGGILHVGPQSAGAAPGPAAYGQGGTQPTVTDADLVLGYLNPEYFLGGRMRLQREFSERTIKENIARPLGVSVQEAAAGILAVVNLKMAAGTKDISVQRGYDPREFPLVVAGGAGPVHAAAIAEELDIDVVIVPKLSSVMCAAGMLLADLRHDFTRSYHRLWSELDSAEARRAFEEMIAAGTAALTREGVRDDRRETVTAADMRYVGQHHEVSVTFPLGALSQDGHRHEVTDAFHRRHGELYGFALPGNPVEIINLRTTLIGRRDGFGLEIGGDAGPTGPASKGHRSVYLPAAGAVDDVEVFDGQLLRVGQELSGPAIIEEATTTVFVPTGWVAGLDRSGSYVLHRRGSD